MSYDVAAVRSHFPALREGAAHFDGPGGSQVPDTVARAVHDTMISAVANRGTVTPAERRAEQIVADCRAALGDLLHTDPAGIVFGRSATALTYDLSRALAKTWRPGDEVVVTRLDHDSNIRPWVQAAEAVGAAVRWVDFDPATGELPVEAVAAQLSDRTRLVATTAASNLIGTRPDVAGIAEAVHEAGALYWVDGVHATAHVLVDRPGLGADFWSCSPYKFLGPHCGVVAADPALLGTLAMDKLLPSSDSVPERFELGTLPYELMAGTTAAVEFLAGLATVDSDEEGSHGAASRDRRARLTTSLAALAEHEDRLGSRLEEATRALPGVRLYSNAARRTPTLLFTVEGKDPQEVRQALADKGINAPASNFYAVECSRRLGLGDGGGVRTGLAPYTDDEDVDRLIEALTAIV
ncbi:cysteine desulfurase-like protein [Intrasporangium sp. DVR]|uniref:cysteine desulfurase-like protein n=1 Tax=Intrasporangium sp. DVR TaxID=3127867 RepID=UPI00313A4F63